MPDVRAMQTERPPARTPRTRSKARCDGISDPVWRLCVRPLDGDAAHHDRSDNYPAKLAEPLLNMVV
jgi:hypothetical protein